VQHRVDGCAGCGRWCRVRGAVVGLSYPIVLAFQWFVYPVTYLLVAAGGFVLELPGLVYLVAFVYPAFAVSELPLLVLRLPVCVYLTVVVFGCLVLLANLLSVIPLANLISSRILTSLVLLAIVLCHLVKLDSRRHGDRRCLGYGGV